jgi:hypothetical protein
VRPRHELLLLLLVGVAALTPISVISAQDRSRVCLSEALLHGHLAADRCLASSGDRASYGGHLYTDKAPGVSVLEVPATALLRPGLPQKWSPNGLRLWGVRVLSVGVALFLLAFLVGRVAEGLRPGFGGVVMVSFALGTLVAPLAATGFEHVPAALLAFATFLLAWARRPLLAGLLGGAALLVEYEAGLVLAVVACYLVATGGWRPLRCYLVGLVPGAALLGVYDWAAFGAPWHLSYRYVAPEFASRQARGLFGIGPPHLLAVFKVFSWTGGLLVISPVIALGAVGLVWLGRAHRAEAIAAGAIAALYVLANCGYFDPYGGTSPGPRFLVAGLPFLGLGPGPAFARLPRLTLLLAACSVMATTALTVTWSSLVVVWGGLWGELSRIPVQGGSSRFVRSLLPNVLGRLGLTPTWSALVVSACAAAALAIAAWEMPRTALRGGRAGRGSKPSLAVALVAAACLCLIGAANVLAVTRYPYGNALLVLPDLETKITAPAPTVYLGGELNLQIDVSDVGAIGAGRLHLMISLPEGLRLVGPPAFTRGAGCTGSAVLDCNLFYLNPRGKQVATVYFGVQATSLGPHTLTAAATAPAAIGNTASLTLIVTP